MSIICAIPVRLGSRRLKQKHLIEVQGRSFLEWLVLRMKAQQSINSSDYRIVIASTPEPENGRLRELAQNWGVETFFGNPHHIPRRLLEAAQYYQAAGVICVDGDDISCSPYAMSTIEMQLKSGKKYVKTSGLPLGMNVAGFSAPFLQDQLDGENSRVLETGWGRIFDEAELQVIDLHASVPAHHLTLRFTLDYEEDARFFKAIIEEFGDAYPQASDSDIVRCVLEKQLYKLVDGVDQRYWQNFADEQNKEDSL